MLKIYWTSRTTNAEVLRQMDIDRKLLTMLKRLDQIFRNMKHQFLKLIMGGKIERKLNIGRRQYLWLNNIRDWTNLGDHVLFRAAKHRAQFVIIVTNIP